MPLTTAVPRVGGVTTANDVAGPPVSASGTLVAAAPELTDRADGPATGTASPTVIE